MAVQYFKVTPAFAGYDTIAVPENPTNQVNSEFYNRRYFSASEVTTYINDKGYIWDTDALFVTLNETQRDTMKSIGFPNVVAATDIQEGRYELDNGSAIVITGHNQYGVNYHYELSDGSPIGPYTVMPGDYAAESVLPSYVVGVDSSDPPIFQWYKSSIHGVGNNSVYYPYIVPYFSAESGDQFWNGLVPSGNDPFAPGGVTGTGGGTGDFDGTSDIIDFPPLPTLSAVDTGFITLFNPSIYQMKALANYMWGGLFDVDTWKKIFADPMDAILGLSIVPVNVPSGGYAEVTVGNISTGLTMTKAASQYVEVDCGTLNVHEFWGAYLDYDPYTKAEIYLPYIGTHPLAVDDIMGKAVSVKYHVDILSGACCAYVRCNGVIMYSFVGQCSCSIPITGNDWTNVINGALSIASSIGTMVATGGASAPMSLTSIASTAVNSLKPTVEKSGALGGMGGMLGVQRPYLMLTRPRQATPARQNSFMGYPSFITMKLADCSGYTEVETIHIENIPATSAELSEIETLLKGGVIF